MYNIKAVKESIMEGVMENIRTKEYNQFIVIAIPESVEIEVNLAISSTIRKLIDKGKKHFAFDFTETRYINSLGIDLIANICKKIKEIDGDFVLFGANGEVLGIFYLMNLDKAITILDNEFDFVVYNQRKEKSQ
jgi:anti-anti-sigma factor